MNKHKKFGFTIIELMVVIVVVAVLATITTIAYRETQKSARDEKRKVDAVMLRSAVEEYYTDNGAFPSPSCLSGPGTSSECWHNEIWQLLKNQGYLKKIPQPEAKSTNTSYNLAANGNANYGWIRGSGNSFGIYVVREGGECKTGKNMTASWWGNAPECDF